MKTIEIPRTRAGTIYHFAELKIGGPPIVVAKEKRSSLESCAWRAAHRLGRTFTVRAFVDEDKQTKVGCWRVEKKKKGKK